MRGSLQIAALGAGLLTSPNCSTEGLLEGNLAPGEGDLRSGRRAGSGDPRTAGGDLLWRLRPVQFAPTLFGLGQFASDGFDFVV